ncbi:MAG: flagellar basal body P-ring formation protein FlgA [Rhizobacter sp.]|nr:flagellar basal body P-ring formation protein FlgA [Rhizobacter sp.]
MALAWLCLAPGAAHAQTPADGLVLLAQRFAAAELAAAGLSHTDVVPGRLDPRLRLAPCEKTQPYLPRGTRLWGKTRVGLRCVKGVTPWNVYVPMTVNVYGPALVSAAALPVGHVLAATDFHQAEVNLAEDSRHAPLTDSAELVGRVLARPLAPGQSIHEAGLKVRQWFAPGEQVQIRVAGNGFAVAGSGEAVTAGVEGQPARVRTGNGRVVSGMPVAERVLEIAL